VQCDASKANNNAVKQEAGDAELSGDAAALVLAILYLLTQMAGFYFSFSHSFIADGRKAYETTRGEPSFSSYETHYVIPALNRAVGPLTELRNHLAQRVESYGRNPSSMTVQDYYERKLIENVERQSRDRESEVKAEARRRAAAEALAPEPAMAAPAPVVSNSAGDAVTDAARRLLAASSDEEKERIVDEIDGDDPDFADKVIAAAETMKSEKESRSAARRSRLKGL
jgi:hypothetical protein